MANGELIVCSCGNVIGEIVCVDKTAFFRAGGALLWAAHGQCATCGLEYHYRATQAKLDLLIRDVQKMRASGEVLKNRSDGL